MTREEHINRLKKIKDVQKQVRQKHLITRAGSAKCSSGEVDEKFLESSNLTKKYSQRIEGFDLSTSREEVLDLLNSIDSSGSVDNILEPVFLSLFDGTMRAFKIGTKQGITASRLYNECKVFSYEQSSKSVLLDSYTENLNERENISSFGEQTTYSRGEMTRSGQQTNMRDSSKMKSAKVAHFDGNFQAEDAYGGEPIYQFQNHAKSKGKIEQNAETDHVVSCAETCNRLKSNKALNVEDIKEIVNVDENLAVTSMQNNRGQHTGKFDKSRDELTQEINQGFVVDEKGKRHNLSDEEKVTRQSMVKKMDEAQKHIDSHANKKVMSNIVTDRGVQKRLAKDAKDAASNQAIGDLVLFMIKPIYYELRDCFINGIEDGVSANSFKSALSIRFARMKKHILKESGNLLKDGMLNFFKNFLTMLLEGIVNCFVGVFQHIIRMVKEGFKILLQIVPILKDKTASMAQKGDAILKLVAGSLSIFASIGIESWLNSLGLGEPWSIIISSILTAVLTALTMFVLDKLDIFGVNRELKLQRIDEILNLRIENTKAEIFEFAALLS